MNATIENKEKIADDNLRLALTSPSRPQTNHLQIRRKKERAEVPMRLNDQAQIQLALAALFAALAKTLGEQYEPFPSRFVVNLERLHQKMKGWEGEPVVAMETLRWTSEILKDLRA